MLGKQKRKKTSKILWIPIILIKILFFIDSKKTESQNKYDIYFITFL